MLHVLKIPCPPFNKRRPNSLMKRTCIKRTQMLHATVEANLIRMTIVVSLKEKEHKITTEVKQHKGPVSAGVTNLQGNFTIR